MSLICFCVHTLVCNPFCRFLQSMICFSDYCSFLQVMFNVLFFDIYLFICFQEKTDLLLQTEQVSAFKAVNELIQQGTHLSLLLKGRKNTGVSDADKLMIQERVSKIFQDKVVSTGMMFKLLYVDF